MSRRRALVFEHQTDCGLGRLEEPVTRRGVAIDVARPGERPADVEELDEPRSYDLVITLGSARSAFDDSVAWVPAELDYLRAAVRDGVPVLGLCFGGQMLARALGAEVRRADAPEVGWKTVARAGVATSWLPAGPWLSWHEDTFAWPPAATALAWTERAPQAFRRGDHLGVQFHPEATREMVEEWLETDAPKLEQWGVDADALRRETESVYDAGAVAADALFASYLDQVLNGARA